MNSDTTQQPNTAFSSFPFTTGMLFDFSTNKFPTRLYAVNPLSGCMCMEFNNGSTYYVFAVNRTVITLPHAGTVYQYELTTGMYACVPGAFMVTQGTCIVIERIGHNGMFMVGGPIEESGRLKYIDGCTDSLLVPPVKLGDPCLNALYFPTGIDQTEHTHPSMRVGVVLSGKGECVTPEGIIPLEPGMIFIIHEDGLHKFRTLRGEPMVVIAYHPDSDYGPTDEEHPMLNRTIVNGVSAKFIDDIRTK